MAEEEEDSVGCYYCDRCGCCMRCSGVCGEDGCLEECLCCCPEHGFLK